MSLNQELNAYLCALEMRNRVISHYVSLGDTQFFEFVVT